MLYHAFFLKQEIFKVHGIMPPLYWNCGLVKGVIRV
jgi:hypothetical protein